MRVLLQADSPPKQQTIFNLSCRARPRAVELTSQPAAALCVLSSYPRWLFQLLLKDMRCMKFSGAIKRTRSSSARGSARSSSGGRGETAGTKKQVSLHVPRYSACTDMSFQARFVTPLSHVHLLSTANPIRGHVYVAAAP